MGQEKISLVNGLNSINKNNSENDNSENNIMNQSIVQPDNIPSNIENMGIFLVNSNWL